MDNLQRRASGIYVARLVVPERLRPLLNRRELIASTRSRELGLAKVVASDLIARWRRRFFDLDRLASAGACMTDHNILKIAEGHPALATAGHLTLEDAASYAGIDEDTLLREASKGALGLFWRLDNTPGYLASEDMLRTYTVEVDGVMVEKQYGGAEIDIPSKPPRLAEVTAASGAWALTADAAPMVADGLLSRGRVPTVVSLAAGRKGWLFVPDDILNITRKGLEVSAEQVNALRTRLAAAIPPDQLTAAREARKAGNVSTGNAVGRHAQKRLSDALEEFTTKELTAAMKNPKEIERVRAGIALLIEFEGNRRLADVDIEVMERFRDVHLNTFLARENQVRHKYKTTSMTESIRAVAGTGPIMSMAERELRMQWIARMFKWLVDQKWIKDNPASAYAGARVGSKAERKADARAKPKRMPFTPEELTAIFSMPWFRSGRGERTAAGKVHRSFMPFKFWLPLLGLHAGIRIGEGSQLWLQDVKQTPGGTWYIDINEDTKDKSTKNVQSHRKVPVHPLLVKAGFIAWCDRLRAEGFQRVFPELAFNTTDQYAKEPIRAHIELFRALGIPRNNTKVFHSFRKNLNTELEKMAGVTEVARNRIMGHIAGDSVNERHYLEDRSPDEAIVFMKAVDFNLPEIAAFDLDFGVESVHAALARKDLVRRHREDMGKAAD